MDPGPTPPVDDDEARRRPVEVRSRVTGLSDHVFGFAATLLAARLVLPTGTPDVTAVEALGDRASTIAIYAFGFLVLGYQWWRHHQVFLRIERISTPLVWTNLAMLACIAVMPYPTAVLSESRVPLAVVLYVVPLLLSSLLLIAIWEYARWRYLQSPGADDPAPHARIRWSLLALPAVLVTSLALLAVDTRAALLAWALLPLVLVLERRLDLGERSSEGGVLTSARQRLAATVSGYVDDGLERVVAYSDGIYAVVLTILAEQLGGEAEVRPGAELTSAELWDQLMSQQHTLWAFLLTFFTVGLFFNVHTEIFARIIRVRTPLLWLALVHLMVIALQPLGLSIFVDYGSGDDTQSTAIYLCFLLAGSLTLSAIGAYADWGNRCVDPATTAIQRRGHRWEAVSSASIFLLALAIALLTDDGDSSWAFAPFALFIVTDRVIDRRFPGVEPGHLAVEGDG